MSNSQYEQYLPTYKEDFKNDKRWLRRETEHYVFYYFPESAAEREIEQISNRQEEAFEKIIKFLEIIPPDRKITYYFYPDAETKKDLMGDDWYAQAILNDFVIHTLYTDQIKPIGEHEDAHLLSLPWGLSIAFFQEGLAEYMVGHSWHGEDHDMLAREALDSAILPTVESMMEHKKWIELNDKHAIYNYAFVASFAKFLINEYGKEKFKTLYKNTDRLKTKKENIDVFEKIYNISVKDMEREWKKKILEL